MDEMIIKISKDSTNASLTLIEGDMSKKKNVSLDDLISSLISDYKLSTGMMPLGTRLFRGSATNFNLALEISAKIRDMSISRLNASGSNRISEIIQVPYPTCLFYFTVRNRKIQELRLFALKYPLQSESDSLFCFPFSNVYIDGRICWGGVTLPKIDKPMDLVGVVNLFLGSQFNGDLAQNNISSPKGKEIRDFWTLISHVKPLQEFPSEILLSTNMKFSHLLKEKE